MATIKFSKKELFEKLDIFLKEAENTRSGGFGSTGYDFDNELNKRIIEKPSSNLKDELFNHIDNYIKKKKNEEKQEITVVDIYKKAQVDRRDYSRFLKDGTLTKSNIICFCIALELDLDETDRLLHLAGLALADIISDRIIKFFFEKQHYDIDDINEALYRYEQKLIGVQKNII